MPIIKRTAIAERYPAPVKERLVEEFIHGEEANRPEGSPLIIIEPALGNRSRIVVVWDDADWTALTQEDRSAAIFDAYADAYGEGSELELMFALGVTRSEAKIMGLI